MNIIHRDMYFQGDIAENWVCHGRVRMVVGFTTIPLQSVPITTNVVSESRSGEVYSIQHYVMKFVSDLWQVNGFLQVLRFHPPKKLTATI